MQPIQNKNLRSVHHSLNIVTRWVTAQIHSMIFFYTKKHSTCIYSRNSVKQSARIHDSNECAEKIIVAIAFAPFCTEASDNINTYKKLCLGSSRLPLVFGVRMQMCKGLQETHPHLHSHTKASRMRLPHYIRLGGQQCVMLMDRVDGEIYSLIWHWVDDADELLYKKELRSTRLDGVSRWFFLKMQCKK